MIVETVGVGQSETEIADCADLVLLCVQPGSGDALQFMKAGIMEVPDLVLVTKADLGAPAAPRRGRPPRRPVARRRPARAGGRRRLGPHRRGHRGRRSTLVAARRTAATDLRRARAAPGPRLGLAPGWSNCSDASD